VRILLVDSASSGHHIPYLQKILSSKRDNIVFFVAAPSGFPKHNGYFELPFPYKKNAIQYFYEREKWLNSIAKISQEIKPDVIHFLHGDAIYQLGGIGLSRISNITEKLVITQHHLPVGKIRNICFRLTAKHFKKIVVHTFTIKESLVRSGVENDKIEVINYPALHPVKLDPKRAKEKLGLQVEQKMLLALGGTRHDKGIDILLQASKLVRGKFCLVVAGKEEDFKEEYIISEAKQITHPVILRLHRLSDEEFSLYLDAADCIVLPYRRSFDGASGPMTEAVWRRKPVIAPSHGSLGDLVKKFNLGYSFESENVKDLAQKIGIFLNDAEAFQWMPEAENFREKISPQMFTTRYSELYESIVEND